jgi:DNA-nicking Smr family endonuclease
MKRRPSSLIPELPEPPRRKRGLSEEDRALWESVAKQVKPLRKRRASKPSLAATEVDTKAAQKPAASPRHVVPGLTFSGSLTSKEPSRYNPAHFHR